MLLATCYAFPNIKGPPGLTSHTIDSVYKDKYQKYIFDNCMNLVQGAEKIENRHSFLKNAIAVILINISFKFVYQSMPDRLYNYHCA